MAATALAGVTLTSQSRRSSTLHLRHDALIDPACLCCLPHPHLVGSFRRALAPILIPRFVHARFLSLLHYTSLKANGSHSSLLRPFRTLKSCHWEFVVSGYSGLSSSSLEQTTPLDEDVGSETTSNFPT